jgi:hypothetical protein
MAQVVLAAVSQNGLALKWASPRLRADPRVLQAAAAQCGASLVFAAEEWWGRLNCRSEAAGASAVSGRGAAVPAAGPLSPSPPCRGRAAHAPHELASPVHSPSPPQGGDYWLATTLSHTPDARWAEQRGPLSPIADPRTALPPSHEPSDMRPSRTRAPQAGPRSSSNKSIHSGGAARAQALETLRRQQYGPLPLLPSRPKRVRPLTSVVRRRRRLC